MSKQSRMEKGTKRRHISEKIISGSVSVVLGIFLIIAVVTAVMVLSLTMSSKETELTLESQSAAYQLSGFFDQYIRTTDQMAVNSQIRDLLKTTTGEKKITGMAGYDMVYDNLVKIAELDSNILAAWVGDADTSTLTQSDGYTSPDGWDITQRPWFAVTKTGEHMLTDPYVDVSTGKLILSVASPVEESGMVGVAGVDISMDQIQEILKTYKVGKEGYVMLVSSDGIIVYHPDSSLIQKNITEVDFSDNLVEQCQKGEEAFLKYRAFGIRKYGYVAEVGDTGFLVVSNMPVQEYYSSMIQMLLMLCVIFIVGIVVVIIAMKRVALALAKPILELNQTAQKLAEGNLDVTLDVVSDDEIGELADSIQATVLRLKEYINYIDEITEVLGKLADGKLSVNLQYAYVGEFQKVKFALENISATMKEVMEGIHDSSMQVSAGSEELAKASQSLAEGATNQAAAAQELLATATTVAEQVEENKMESEKAAGKTKEVTDLMAVSKKNMEQMTEAMNKIQDTSKKVVGVIQAIEEIASQTNLLSLNASIEAARAGEVGRGFAVVAGEIGGLAEESAQAVNKTRDLIQISLSEIDRGTQFVKEVEESIRVSVEAVEQVNRMIQKTAENAVCQAQSVEQIRQGVEEMSCTIQDNSAMAEESAATSQELAAQAETLNDLVQRFELNA